MSETINTFLEPQQCEEVRGLVREGWAVEDIANCDIPCHPDHWFQHPEHHEGEKLPAVFTVEDVYRACEGWDLEILTYADLVPVWNGEEQ
jgi:hypothetical protein